MTIRIVMLSTFASKFILYFQTSPAHRKLRIDSILKIVEV